MRKAYQTEEVLARGKDVYIGMDVHRDSWHVTALVEGEEVFNGRIPGQYKVFRRLIERFQDCRVRAAYEAGPCGFWLYDRLTEDGIEAIVTPPSLIPVESGNKVKTDRRDSRKLAGLLKNNLLKRVHVLSEEERADRELLRTRRQLINHRSDVARQIKSKLLFYGISSPFPAKHKWTGQYIQWLKGIIFKENMLKITLKSLIELYEYLSKQVREISKEVIKLSRSSKYIEKIKLLKSIPGIGSLSAMEILVELQDVSRFRRSENIASYIGLTPAEYSTGQYVRQGRITRCGNKRVRTALVESSWILIAKDPYMRFKYMKLKSAKGGKRAIIAIARNLIVRIRKILMSHEPYVVGV